MSCTNNLNFLIVFASSFAFREGCLWKGWCSSLSLSCGSTHTFSSSVVLTRILHRRRRCIAVLIVQVLLQELLGRIPGQHSYFRLPCWWHYLWRLKTIIVCIALWTSPLTLQVIQSYSFLHCSADYYYPSCLWVNLITIFLLCAYQRPLERINFRGWCKPLI